MKRLMLICVIGAFVVTSSVVLAAGNAPLGSDNLAFRLDYIAFTEHNIEDLGVDTAWLIGLEAFREVIPNLYCGFEVGYAHPNVDVEFGGILLETEVTYVPVELNLKYAVEVAPEFIIDFGAGASYNYAEFEVSLMGASVGSEDNWLFGGQFFLDLNYRLDPLFFGVHGKYQITEELRRFRYDFNNWRIGGQIGFVF
jgi:hypothetical protein